MFGVSPVELLIVVIGILGLVAVWRGLLALVGLFKSVQTGHVKLACPHCGQQTSHGRGQCDVCGHEL